MNIGVCENRQLYAAYHAIYKAPDINCHDWQEEMEILQAEDTCFFVFEGKSLLGGFVLNGTKISLPFVVAPFSDKKAFWEAVLSWAREQYPDNYVDVYHIPQEDADILLRMGARKKWAQQRMCRPTDNFKPELGSAFLYEAPQKKDCSDIVQAVYQAHKQGYTATVYGPPDLSEIHRMISYRLEAFEKTNTLHFSIVARDIRTNEIAGVCMAGIYPDSRNHFSTIHQVSVRPEYQNRGLARSMMQYSISAAHSTSPVITLQVLIGNPAVHLYEKLGFVAGPSFTDMVYNKNDAARCD